MRRLATLILLLLVLASSSLAKPAKVKLAGDIEKKFPNIQLILDQLVETLESPELWDKKVLRSRVPRSGYIVDYRYADIAKEIHSYLTSGEMTLIYKPDSTKLMFRAAASTAVRDRIALHSRAGSWEAGKEAGKASAPYSDYRLARTIFHELVHTWQLRTFTFPNVGDKETPAYYVEGKLPSTLFDTTDHPDPDGTTPVPAVKTPEKEEPPPPVLPTGLRLEGLFVDDVPAAGYGGAGVQFSLQGPPSLKSTRVRYKGSIKGNGLTLPVSGGFKVPGPGYHGEPIPFALPSSAPAGTYTLQLALFVEGLASKFGSDTFTKAAKPSSTPSPSPTPTPSVAPLSVSITSGLETVVGDNYTFSAAASGGSGRYEFHWKVTGLGAKSGSSFTESFSSTGKKLVSLEVTDSDHPGLKAATASQTLIVHPELKVTILGPTKAPADSTLTLRADVSGGIGPYDYSWTTSAGSTSTKMAISGKLRGKVGEKKKIILVVTDKRKKIADDDHEVEITKGLSLDIVGIQVTPRVIDRGSSAEVTVSYTVPTDGTYRLDGRFETSSASGRGKKAGRTVSAKAGVTQTAKFRFRTRKDGKPGPLSIRLRLRSDSESRIKGTTAILRKPIDMARARQRDLVGRFRMSDPNRNSDDYRGTMLLKRKGRGTVTEFLNGGKMSGSIAWSFKKGVFTLKSNSSSATFSGKATGSTKKFDLKGTWSNRAPGTLHLHKL